MPPPVVYRARSSKPTHEGSIPSGGANRGYAMKMYVWEEAFNLIYGGGAVVAVATSEDEARQKIINDVEFQKSYHYKRLNIDGPADRALDLDKAVFDYSWEE